MILMLAQEGSGVNVALHPFASGVWTIVPVLPCA
jgi:hypothetical protein